MKIFIDYSRTVTSIEDISNELFYDIFDYLDGYDILNAFQNLNLRFEKLLNDNSLLLKLKISSQSILDNQWKGFLLINRHRIYSLNISDDSILDRFIHHCTINSTFIRLQSLNLNSLPAYKFLALLSDLISLPRLCSLTCSLTSCFVDVSYIYRIVFRFRYLNYLKLSLPIIEDLEDFEQSICVIEQERLSEIEYLVMDHCCTLHDFLSIISFMPKLRHLTCQTLFQIEENISKENFSISRNLTHLTIDRCQLKFHLLQILIEKLPSQLQTFRLVNHSNDYLYLDAYRWEELITEYLPCLKTFSLQFYEHLNDRWVLTPSHRSLNRFLSPFWFDRQWIIGLELQTHHLIYSIKPYRYSFDDHPFISSRKSSWSDPTITYDIKYRCNALWSETFNEYFISIFSLMKITYLEIDCAQIPLLICLKLIGLLSDLQTLKICSLSLSEAKRLSAEKWKTIHAVAYQNKITKVLLEKMSDFGEIQFLTILCPSIEFLHISPIDEINLDLLIPFIQMKQNNQQLINLSTLSLDTTNEIIKHFESVIREKFHFQHYRIQYIDNRIYFKWTT